MSGWLSFLQFGREATYGVLPTITHRMLVKNLSPKIHRGHVEPTYLDGSLANTKAVAGPKMCPVKFEFPVTFSSLNLWWDLLWGTNTYAANGGVTTGPIGGIYRHAFAGFKPLINSMALEFGMADIPTGTCELYLGFKPTRFSVKSGASIDGEEQILLGTIEGIAKSQTLGATPTGALVAPASPDYVQHHLMVGQLSQSGSTAPRTLNWELIIDLIAKERLFAEGSGLISEPRRPGRPKVRFNITEEWQTNAAVQAYIDNTPTSFQTRFELATAGDPKYLEFSGTGVIPEPPVRDINDDGIPNQSFSIHAQNNGSGSTLALLVGNQQALITTP